MSNVSAPVSQAPASQAPASVSVTAESVGAPLATWTTKNGTVKVARTHTGTVFAPKSVRLGAALEADLQKLINGQYRPFIQELLASCNKKQLSALQSFVVLAYTTTTPDGMSLVPAGDVFAKSNKGLAVVVASWASNPTETIKVKGEPDVIVHCAKLTPRMAALQTLARAWIALFDAEHAPSN